MDDMNQSANLQETQISQPIEQPVQQPIQKDKNIFKYLFFALLILFLGIIITLYFVLVKKTNTVSEVTSTPTTVPVVTSTESRESTLTEIDDEWNLYTNYKYRFTLKTPKRALFTNTCSTADMIEEPVNFFENQDTIYFANQYFNEKIGDSCIKQETKITNMNSWQISNLPIYVTKVSNDEEIEQFIKLKFGSGCSLGEKTQSGKNNIFNISILGDGKDLDETECPINYVIEPKYNYSKQELLIFIEGQACAFYKNTGYECYIEEIVNSLEFF